MGKLILFLKWCNYFSLFLGVFSFIYFVVINPISFGTLLPAYAIIFSFCDLFVLSFVNKAAGNTTFNIFKDWMLFFGSIGIYIFITLIIAMTK
ncbi:hypothetical protein [Flavobacterium sp. CAN_S2]|uniref:hypothetical protein n=1 Tax=Flavobacterium sp. CAN_S2 TaxID=2787726 RepID=UPI0018CB4C22